MGEMVDLDGVAAYRAEPAGVPKGGLILIHEIWGLVPHITDVADRYAAEGYLVLAPDLLSVAGITPETGLELHRLQSEPDEAKRTAAQPVLREKLAAAREPEFAAGAVARLRKVVDALEAEPGVDGRIAVTGFCFGGTYSFALAAADNRVKAAVPFYGTAPAPDKIAQIACPILAMYGEIDPAIMEALPETRRLMAEAGVDFTAQVYEGAQHAFFNDTSPSRYDPDAAADAWSRALDFLGVRLASA